MSNSREGSPDWLHSYQAPIRSFLTLSSDSEPSATSSPIEEDEISYKEPAIRIIKPSKSDQNQATVLIDSEEDSPVITPPKSKSLKSRVKTETLKRKRGDGVNGEDVKEEILEKPVEPKKRKGSGVKQEAIKEEILEKTSEPHVSSRLPLMISEKVHRSKRSSLKGAYRWHLRAEHRHWGLRHTPQGFEKGDGVNGEDVKEEILEKPVEPKKRKGSGVKQEAIKEEILEKTSEPHVSSRLPLMISEKVHRSKALVECEGESIDMSGDVGAVGRVVITDAQSGDPEMLLDLKGTIYKTTVIPSRTFCVVSFNQAEAKIEAVMNDFIQLKPISNVYEAETMIEGTLDGFSYDSEEETNRLQKPNGRQSDQNNEGDELANGKTKKKAEKSLRMTRRKGKTAAKPPKKGTNKTQGPKKAKNDEGNHGLAKQEQVLAEQRKGVAMQEDGVHHLIILPCMYNEGGKAGGVPLNCMGIRTSCIKMVGKKLLVALLFVAESYGFI
ncbi:Dna-binding protein bin4 [Thalictrum thalictroides]|uniref:Dna-binding protein bin4 n=1 Tax=Thalictrum thalictroides TaxID=46969 RepID=A0A7J6WKR9_THATH|nr:Dna-binding protein bin4 [Thalictrum thalictroides]